MKLKLTALMGIIVVLGVLVSGYLSYAETFGKTPVCPIITGCATVAQSSYSYIGGIPVAVFGLVAWLVLLWCAYNLHVKNNAKHSWYIFALACVGIIAAGYFNGVMYKITAFCIWCEVSHILMLSVFLISAILAFGRISIYSLVTCFVLFALPFAIGMLVSENETANFVAQCLAEKNVIMYGTSWCTHCQEQKDIFGEAFSNVPYVECSDPKDPYAQTPACEKANIESYPTWVRADNARITGAQSLTELADWAGCNNK